MISKGLRAVGPTIPLQPYLHAEEGFSTAHILEFPSSFLYVKKVGYFLCELEEGNRLLNLKYLFSRDKYGFYVLKSLNK